MVEDYEVLIYTQNTLELGFVIEETFKCESLAMNLPPPDHLTD